MKAIDKIKRMHQATGIERKDKSLNELVTSAKDNKLVITITGFKSKYVSKYDNGSCLGMNTIMYTKEHGKVGAFSNALYDFASFFYKGAGCLSGDLSLINFNQDGWLKVEISKVKLDAGKSTYNFEILDGEIKGIERLSSDIGSNIMLEGVVIQDDINDNTPMLNQPDTNK